MRGGFRNKIREWIIKREIWLVRILYFAIILASVLVLNKSFGYIQVVSKPYFAVLFALLGAFLPAGGVALFLVIYLLLQLFFVSLGVTAVTAALILFLAIVSIVFQAKRQLYFVFAPVLYRLNLVYIAPIEAGFMGSKSEVVSVIGGAVMAFFLREVRANASLFVEPNGSITVLSLIRNNILGNQMFYIFVVAMVVMFLAISFIHGRAFKNAWFIALVIGIVLEFMLMLAGYLFTENTQQIPSLLVANGLAFVFGLLFTVVFHDMDHSRMEKLQFEDDEYYYYVTAVPKIQFVQEEKDVKNITEEKS